MCGGKMRSRVYYPLIITIVIISVSAQIASTSAFAGPSPHPRQHPRTTQHRRTTTHTVSPTTTYHTKTTPRSSTNPTTTSLPSLPTTALCGICQSKIFLQLASSLRSGPYGIPALFALASTVNLPLTLYRQAYSFSVGYAFSVFTMATACALAFPTPPSPSPSLLLTTAAAFYGLRLGAFLLAREATVPSKAEVLRRMDTTPRSKRVPLVANVSLFYALLTAPVLYALRSPVPAGTARAAVASCGAALAWFGAALEALADLQKWTFYRGRNDAGASGGAVSEGEGEGRTFAGPTGYAYSVVRHPNYLGEVLFWTGIFVGGAPSFGRSYVAWIGSALGLSGIWAVMLAATKRLEGKQRESFGGQEAYENWTLRTRYPLLPFLG